MGNIETALSEEKVHSDDEINFILTKTKELQERAGYDGDFMSWAEKNTPVRLEDM